MKTLQKIVLPALVGVIVAVVYFEYFAPKSDLGDFSKFGESEINKRINVLVVKEQKFARNKNGDIFSFIVRDRKNKIVFVSMREPVPEKIKKAEVVELFGHLHGNNFAAASVKIIK